MKKTIKEINQDLFDFGLYPIHSGLEPEEDELK